MDDFDSFADEYRKIHTENIKLSGTDSDYFSRMKIALLQQYEVNASLRVLDIGCGDGNSCFYMNRLFPSWSVNGIDISIKSIRIAQQRKISNTEFQQYDGAHMPFNDEYFDIIFIAGVLHHVPFTRHRSLLEEAYRVCKREGRIYIFEHNPFNPLTKYFVNTCVFDREAVLLRASYLQQVLKNSGFSTMKKKYIIFFPRHKLFRLFWMLEPYLSRIPLGGQYFFRAVK